MTFPELTLTVTQDRVRAYAALSADANPIHLNADFAAITRFGRPIAHGTMALNLALRACARHFGPDWPTGVQVDIRFVAPVHVGANLLTRGHQAGPGEWSIAVEADGVTVLTGHVRLGPR